MRKSRKLLTDMIIAAVVVVAGGAVGYKVTHRPWAFPWKVGDQSGARLVTFGHSYVQGAGVSDRSQAWAPQTAKALCAGLLDWGHGGDMASQTVAIVNAHDNDVRAQDDAVVQIGLNDLRRYGTDARHLASFEADLAKILDEIHGRETFVLGVEPIKNWGGFAPFNHGSDAAVALYNTAMERVAGMSGAVYIAPPAGWSPSMDLSTDGVHPDGAGHKLLAQTVTNAAETHGITCR